MATLTLTETWINLESTGEAVSAWRQDSADSDTAQMVGRVETYAGGRQRSITVEGVATSLPFTLVGLSMADTVTLRSWFGETVLYRDNLGRKMYGVLYEGTRTPWKQSAGATWNIEMVVLGVDVDEAV